MLKKYTAEQIAYLRQIAPGHYIYEIIELLNEKFGLNVTKSQVKSLMKNHGVTNGMRSRCPPDKLRRLTSPAQDEWIKRHADGKSSAELQNMIKEKFGIVLSLSQIKSYKKRKKINTGLTGRFEKGHTPFNKGKKMPPEIYAKCAPTMFKKGQPPVTVSPIGTESLRSDGYIWVKIAVPNKWRPKHIIIWENAHGPRPKGHKIIFADGNRLNFTLDNLLLVSDAELARLNQNNLIFDNAEVTKTGVLVARAITQVNKLKKNIRRV